MLLPPPSFDAAARQIAAIVSLLCYYAALISLRALPPLPLMPFRRALRFRAFML